LAEVNPIGDDTPSTIALSGHQPPGAQVATTVVASPLIQVTGQATIVGTSPEGFEVVRVNSSDAAGWHARVASACNSCLRAISGNAPLPLLLGKLASVVGVLGLLGWILLGARASGASVAIRRRRATSV
jgi:hypothetical protein